MPKLYFYWGCMSAGKSAHLLQSAHNYQQGGKRVALFSTVADSITSRTGLQADATRIHRGSNITISEGISCILIDESQFLSAYQVYTLLEISLRVPVLCYGLRSGHKGTPFEGSAYLLALAHELCEIKTICYNSHCGRKATMVMRLDLEGKKVTKGPVIDLDAKYQSVCVQHFIQAESN